MIQNYNWWGGPPIFGNTVIYGNATDTDKDNWSVQAGNLRQQYQGALWPGAGATTLEADGWSVTSGGWECINSIAATMT